MICFELEKKQEEHSLFNILHTRTQNIWDAERCNFNCIFLLINGGYREKEKSEPYFTHYTVHTKIKKIPSKKHKNQVALSAALPTAPQFLIFFKNLDWTVVNLKAWQISALHCIENPIYVFPETKWHGLVPNFYINRDQTFILDSYRPFICSVKLESFYQRGLDPGSFKTCQIPCLAGLLLTT